MLGVGAERLICAVVVASLNPKRGIQDPKVAVRRVVIFSYFTRRDRKSRPLTDGWRWERLWGWSPGHGAETKTSRGQFGWNWTEVRAHWAAADFTTRSFSLFSRWTRCLFEFDSSFSFSLRNNQRHIFLNLRSMFFLCIFFPVFFFSNRAFGCK